jgi:hypothetical protein
MACRVFVSATLPGMDGVHERQALGGLHDAQHELPGDAARLLVHAEGAEVVLDRALAMDAHGGQVVEDDGQVAVDQGRICLASSASTRSPWSISASMARSRCWWVTPSGMAGIATVSSQRRQPSFESGAQRRLNTMARTRASTSSLRLPGAQGPPEGPVEAEVLPQLVQREATDCSVEAVDQRIELSGRDLVDPPEVGDNLDANLAFLVAVPLDKLEIAAAARCRDARVYWTNDIPASIMPSSGNT